MEWPFCVVDVTKIHFIGINLVKYESMFINESRVASCVIREQDYV